MTIRASTSEDAVVRVVDLFWTMKNIEHIAKHGVESYEVEEVVFGNVHITRARGGTYRAIGQTASGRYLTIYLAHREDGEYFVVTARDATPQERRAYRLR